MGLGSGPRSTSWNEGRTAERSWGLWLGGGGQLPHTLRDAGSKHAAFVPLSRHTMFSITKMLRKIGPEAFLDTPPTPQKGC